MACHGFDDGPEVHGAALGVSGAAVSVFLRDGCEEEKIPIAGGLEEGEGGLEGIDLVALGPGVLVEGLDDMVGLAGGVGKGLAEPEGEDNLTVGEMSGHLADAPLARNRVGVDLCGAEGRGDGANTACRGVEDGDRVLPAEEAGVRVELHSEKISRRMGRDPAISTGDFILELEYLGWARGRRCQCSRDDLRGRDR